MVLVPDSKLFDVWKPPYFGEAVSVARALVPPGTATTVSDLMTAIAKVGNGGLVLATSGEFRQAIGVVKTHGFDRAHPFTISANYRSYEVDAWRAGGDGVGTVDDPFGPGWRASWGDMIVPPAVDGAPVTRVDEHGVSWTHVRVDPPTMPIGWVLPPPLTYDGQSGTRLVRENHTVGGQSASIWFREWPDRTRLEYAAVTGSGASLVAKRYYRGSYSAPDWQVVLTYDVATGKLAKITDARGIQHVMTWATYGGSSRRITKISSQAPVAWGGTTLETNFEYSTTSPYQLVRASKPPRTFLDDQDRSGVYDTAETFTGPIVTHFTYVGGSNRIERVYDESTGLSRQMLEVAYDPAVTWRVSTMQEGEASTLPGQGPRLQAITYPQPNRTTWTDPRGVVRHYDYDPSFGSSPRQWRVTSVIEKAGPNDPRPTSDPNFHAQLQWQFAWACGCGQLTSVTMPSGIKHVVGYDSEGRGLVVSTGVIPVGQSTAQQTRTWTYRTWNDSDYRLASRLSSYKDACGEIGVNAFTFDPTYGGYRVDGSFSGTSLFSVQEDAAQRVLWTEEAPFDVDGGGTSAARTAYAYGATSTSANQLITQVDSYKANGTTLYSSRSVSYTGFGWPQSETDDLGRTTTFTYDSVAQLVSVALPTTASGRGGATYGSTITFQYDRRSQVARVSRSAHSDQGGAYSHSSVVRTHIYDCFGRPWKEVKDTSALGGAAAASLTTTNEFDLGNRLWRVLASAGRETQYLYDDHNQLYRERKKIDASTWAVEEHGYHLDGVLARVVEPTGLVATVDTFDSWGRPERIHLPGDKHVHLERDNENRLTKSEYRTGVSAILKQTTNRILDDLGNVLSETLVAPGLATQRVVTYSYTGPSRVASAIDGDARGATYGYDERGRLVRKQDRLLGALGNAEVFTRDVAGNVTRVDHVEQRQTGPSTYVPVTYRVDLAYDSWDRLIRTDFFGSAGSVQFSRYRGYDSVGNATWIKDGVGKEARRAFDAVGRKIDEWLHQRNPAASAIHLGLTYNDAPSDPSLSAIVTRTDGVGNASEYRYDLLGRLVDRRLPGYVTGVTAKQWMYQYDVAGRLTEWRDGNGTRVQSLYDAQKRLAQRKVVQLPTNGVILSPMATHETWAHDDFDRVVSSQTWWSSYPHFSGSQPPSLVEVVNGFDGIDRQVLERFRYLDDPNPGYVPVATKDLVYGYVKAGGEDAAFRRSLLTSAGFDIGTAPDDAGKLAAMTLAGPGIASQPLATWVYEGSRPIKHGLLPGSSLTTELRTEYGYNALRHMTQATTSKVVNSVATTIRHLVMERDAEGVVTQHRYGKASGALGDWFLLDGWDRLQEAKLGVGSFTGTYGGASGYDSKLTYALDEAHNRTTVDEEVGGSIGTTTYQRIAGANEYQNVTQPNGDQHTWLYDGNGNLLSDGYYLYVYDHLDRLSEVYLLTYPGGATDETAAGPVVQVYGVEVQKRRSGKESFVPTQLWRERVEQARGRVQGARSASSVSASDPRVPFGANAGTAGTAAAAVDESVPVLVAHYGYDPSNRRIGKLLPDFSGAIYAWSGWNLAEAYDLVFAPTTVWFEGSVIDEHLGYAHRNPSSGAWARYSYVRDHTRGVVSVTDSAGAVLEIYEYDPYGRMSSFTPAGVALGSGPTLPGQVYGFSARQVDAETGLLYYRNRYYDPRAGRFLTSDPRGLFGDSLSNGNSYAYVGSRPHSWVDPLGLYTVVFVSANLTGQDRADAEALAADLVARDPEGGKVVKENGDGSTSEEPAMGPHLPNDDDNDINVFVIAHGDGKGHIRPHANDPFARFGQYSALERTFLDFIASVANGSSSVPGQLGRIVVGVCWSQSEERERRAGVANLCRVASVRAGGRPTHGHEGVGGLSAKGEPENRETDPPTPEPGPYSYPSEDPGSQRVDPLLEALERNAPNLGRGR